MTKIEPLMILLAFLPKASTASSSYVRTLHACKHSASSTMDRCDAQAVSAQSASAGTVPICLSECGSARQPAPSVAEHKLNTEPHMDPAV